MMRHFFTGFICLLLSAAAVAQSNPDKFIRIIKAGKDSLPVLKTTIEKQLNEWSSKQQKQSGNLKILVNSTDRLAAEGVSRWLANQQKKDIYQVSLSGLISTYIGETEMNLEQVFSKAVLQNTILLFDEADALFGSRNLTTEENADREKAVGYFIKQLSSFKGPVVVQCTGEDCNRRLSKVRLIRISG